uniref:Truncated accessory protein 3c n=1 Tax=Feline coronavirus TaxID=12663 RepID=C5IGG9_9ALPC|nr:truncated accessory protein 3c [Feline coronavirus]
MIGGLFLNTLSFSFRVQHCCTLCFIFSFLP